MRRVLELRLSLSLVSQTTSVFSLYDSPAIMVSLESSSLMKVTNSPECVCVFCRTRPEGLSNDIEIGVDVNRRRANPDTGKLEGLSS